MKGRNPDDFVCIFGYQLIDGKAPIHFTKDQVFYPESVINGMSCQPANDFLVIKVKKGIPKDRICQLEGPQMIDLNAPLYVIGHPSPGFL